MNNPESMAPGSSSPTITCDGTFISRNGFSMAKSDTRRAMTRRVILAQPCAECSMKRRPKSSHARGFLRFNWMRFAATRSPFNTSASPPSSYNRARASASRLNAARLRGSPPLPMPIMVSDNAMRGYVRPKSRVVREPIEQLMMCALLTPRWRITTATSSTACWWE